MEGSFNRSKRGEWSQESRVLGLKEEALLSFGSAAIVLREALAAGGARHC